MTPEKKIQTTEFSITRSLFQVSPFGFLLLLHFFLSLLRLLIVEGVDSKIELIKFLSITVSLIIFCLLDQRWQERLKTVLPLAVYLIYSILEAERINAELGREENNNTSFLVFGVVLMQALFLFKEIMIQALAISLSLTYFVIKNFDLNEPNLACIAEILLLIVFTFLFNIYRESQIKSSTLHFFLEKNFLSPIIIIRSNNKNEEELLFANTVAKRSFLSQTRNGSALDFCKGLKFKLLGRKNFDKRYKKNVDLRGLVSETRNINTNEQNKKVFRVYQSGLTQHELNKCCRRGNDPAFIFGEEVSETHLSINYGKSSQYVSKNKVEKGSYIVTASNIDLGPGACNSVMLLFEENKKEMSDVQFKNNLMSFACKKLESLMNLIFCTIENIRGSSLGDRLARKNISSCEKLTKILYFKIRNLIDIASYDDLKRRIPNQRFHKLGPLLNEVLKIMKLLSKTKEISIIKDYENYTNTDIACDSELLVRILVELFENAIKNTNYRGTIVINAKLKRPNRKLLNFSRLSDHLHRSWYIQITVEDNGCGIREECIGGLFKLYSRQNREIQSFECLKTGLPLCHKLLKHMLKPEERRFALFSVKSALNRGTAFSFMLPTSYNCGEI